MLLLAGLLSSGCASSYRPAAGPRVQVIQTSSGLAFMRRGQYYDDGFFGGGLGEVVRGVPKAEEYAQIHQNLRVGGFIFGLGGIALAGGSIAVAAQSAETPEDSVRQSRLALALGIGAAVSSLIGAFMYGRSPAPAFDAVNVYNDQLDKAIRRQRHADSQR
jgi:hypothetical protein